MGSKPDLAWDAQPQVGMATANSVSVDHTSFKQVEALDPPVRSPMVLHRAEGEDVVLVWLIAAIDESLLDTKRVGSVITDCVACASRCRDNCEAGMASFCEELSATAASPRTVLTNRDREEDKISPNNVPANS